MLSGSHVVVVGSVLTSGLQALIGDLGLDSCTKTFIHQLCDGPMHSNPLTELNDLTTPDKIALSTGGCVCLVAYWVFSSTIFDADHPRPEMHLFPEHFAVLDKFLQDDAHAQIQRSAGTIEALVAIGLWLESNGLLSTNPTSPLTNPTTSPEDPTSDFMRYIHLATLIALYHPQLQVRNAASALAGLVLHADPSDDDRLRILYDLLENCMFAALKARAIFWLREEMLAASAAAPKQQQQHQEQQQQEQQQQQRSLFATPQPLETLQYVVFPSLAFLLDGTAADQVEYLAQNATFLLQAVNFGLFLWGGGDAAGGGRWATVTPANLEATVRERWFEPLAEVVERVQREGTRPAADLGPLGPLEGEVALLGERLDRLGACEAFRVKG